MVEKVKKVVLLIDLVVPDPVQKNAKVGHDDDNDEV